MLTRLLPSDVSKITLEQFAEIYVQANMNYPYLRVNTSNG